MGRTARSQPKPPRRVRGRHLRIRSLPAEQNIFDKTNQCRASGATEAQTLSFGRTVRAVWTYLVTGEGQDLAQREWDAVADQPWFEKAYNGPPMMERERILAHPRMTSFVEHSSFEPAPVLASVRVPMLAVFGEKDTVVPIDRSEAAMRDGFRKSGNRDLTVLHVQNADHGLRVPQADGTLALAEGYPDAVVDWVVTTTAKKTTTDSAP
ncbi:MAG: alpha/beta hydrolase [Candidatus Eisenbacteria bacterium]